MKLSKNRLNGDFYKPVALLLVIVEQLRVELNINMMELDDQNFEEEILKSEKLVLVSFWRPGCGPCLTMEPIIEEVAKEFNNRVEVGKLNIIENPETAKVYGIPATPTLIIFKDGKPIEKAVGLRPKQILIDKLNSLL